MTQHYLFISKDKPFLGLQGIIKVKQFSYNKWVDIHLDKGLEKARFQLHSKNFDIMNIVVPLKHFATKEGTEV